MGDRGDITPAAIGARLDRMPITSFHHRLALIVAAGLIVDGIDIYIASGVSGALLREGFASLSEVGYLAMATPLGLAAGAAITGFLADRFGRLALMRVTIVVIALAGFAVALAQSLEQLLFWRLVVALALGGETVLAFGIVTEFMPARVRGRWMAWTALLASLGLPLSMGLGYFVLPLEHGWRWMFAVPAIAAIGIFFLRLGLLESPRWLVARGRSVQAQAIVEKVEASARTPLNSLVTHQHTPMREPGRREAVLESASLWKRFGAAVAINVASLAAVFGFVSWLPTFFVASGLSVASSALFSTIMLAGAPVGTAAAMLVADWFERKWSVAWTAVLAAAVGAIYALVREPALIMAFGFLAIVAIYLFATLGMISYAPELFRTAERLRALGTASAIGRMFAFVLPMAVVPLFAATGQAGVVGAVAAILLAQALVIALIGPRTKGRALEEV